MKIIIPASGIGKRFINSGYVNTKPLIEVINNKRIIDYVFDLFDRDNDEFFIISGDTTFSQMDEFLKTTNLNYKHFISTGPKLGPVGAILDVYNDLVKFIKDNDEVIVSYCDYGGVWNYQEFLRYVKESGVDGCIPCYVGYHPHLEDENNVYAACKKYDNSNKVFLVKEKYKSKDRFNESWSAGLYYFRSMSIMNKAFNKMVENKDKLNGEYYVSLSYNYLIDDNLNITAYDNIEKFYQFGTPTDFEYAKEKLKISSDLLNDRCNIENIIVLSAGRGERFLNLGYDQPKPFIPLNGTDFVSNITESFKNVNSNITFIGSKDHEKYWHNRNVTLITPNKIGAAFSYKEGASNISGETLILPCDLIAKHITQEFINEREDADAIIFTANPTSYALNNKNSFAWVYGSNNIVKDITIKEAKYEDGMVLIGSFWMKNNELLLSYIDKIFNDKFTVNGEYYLDNAFKRMLDEGLKLKYIKLENYLSFGTHEEYIENKYWFNGF